MTAPQRTPEWHGQRLGRVTGSNVGAILGLDPYRTRADVLRAMVRASHGAPTEFTGNTATEWGTAMEPMAVGEFELETGLSVEPMPFVPFEDWLGASPDGLCSDGWGLEVKCPYSIRNDSEPVFKSVEDQPHYYAQKMIEAYCSRWEGIHFWQWTPHGRSHDKVERNDAWLAEALPKLKAFHAEYLDAMKEPAEHLAPLRLQIDTPDAHKMVAEYDQLSEAIERATERKKDLLAEMAALAKDKNALFAGRKLTKVEKEGAVSYAKALKELCPGADLEKWRGKGSEYWRLS